LISLIDRKNKYGSRFSFLGGWQEVRGSCLILAWNWRNSRAFRISSVAL